MGTVRVSIPVAIGPNAQVQGRSGGGVGLKLDRGTNGGQHGASGASTVPRASGQVAPPTTVLTLRAES